MITSVMFHHHILDALGKRVWCLVSGSVRDGSAALCLSLSMFIRTSLNINSNSTSRFQHTAQ